MPGRPTALLLLALAGSLAGCGGDSEESAKRTADTATTPTERAAPQRGRTEGAAAPRRGASLTAAEYRRATNRLCREDEATAERLGEPNSPEQLEPYVRRVVRFARKRQPLYDRLRPPPDLRASHEESMRIGERGIAAFVRLLDRLEDGGDPGRELTNAFPTIVRFIEDGNRVARRMGVKDCIVEVPSPGAELPRSSS